MATGSIILWSATRLGTGAALAVPLALAATGVVVLLWSAALGLEGSVVTPMTGAEWAAGNGSAEVLPRAIGLLGIVIAIAAAAALAAWTVGAEWAGLAVHVVILGAGGAAVCAFGRGVGQSAESLSREKERVIRRISGSDENTT